MILGSPPLSAPQRGPRRGYAARQELSGARREAGCVRRRVRLVHFWALQDQQKPEKEPGMRSSDWPTRAWVGEGGGGQERGGRWKNRRGWFGRGGLSFGSHPCQHSFFLSYQKSPPPTLLRSGPTAPPTHGPWPRDLPREFHIGIGQVRRNAGGGVPGKTPPMDLRLCSPKGSPLPSPCCVLHPAPPPGGSLQGPPYFSPPAALGAMQALGTSAAVEVEVQ
jgi:hypothetical protein